MTTEQTYQNILLCTDYSKDAEMAFTHAFDQAMKHHAKLHIMNVIPSVNPCEIHLDTSVSKQESRALSIATDGQYRLEELGALKKVYSERCQELDDHEFVVKVGSPDLEIIDYSEKNHIDMIFLGTAGRNEKNRLIYIRTAANVSKFSNCQVITIGGSGGSPEHGDPKQPGKVEKNKTLNRIINEFNSQ
ncbi:MAG: universal stress protein [Desulfobacteraceae bacterium]|nr:universal stress protein [Desulfobacteraceae bacterium]